MSCSCQPKEGGTACIRSLASLRAMRRQALRIKTGSKLGQHSHDSRLWAETAPMAGDRGGQQVDTVSRTEVRNGWCLAGGRDPLRPGLRDINQRVHKHMRLQ